MRQLGVEPAPRTDISDLRAWRRWFSLLTDAVPKIQTFEVTINPESVAANTTAEQTFTISGLTTNDVVVVNKPSHTTGISIGNARVSSANTIAITFSNNTATPIDPPSEVYLVFATRI